MGKPGRFAVDPESRGPASECVYFKLLGSGYSSAFLVNVDAKDRPALKPLCDLVCGCKPGGRYLGNRASKITPCYRFLYVQRIDLSIHSGPGAFRDCRASYRIDGGSKSTIRLSAGESIRLTTQTLSLEIGSISGTPEISRMEPYG